MGEGHTDKSLRDQFWTPTTPGRPQAAAGRTGQRETERQEELPEKIHLYHFLVALSITKSRLQGTATCPIVVCECVCVRGRVCGCVCVFVCMSCMCVPVLISNQLMH
ncbi:hypothetical protein JOB18_045755 [Solea senegalensis]|uniref:Uncharacterized protein n=1 Tax=Solea senegalensis TaxID=28829 RepID=A0AAV6SPI6_SOLSE|nr:hypothetical protein JOB18_045755 [Solea senegalensis]